MKTNIEIRQATEEDRYSIMELWKYSFNDTDDFIDYYFDRRFSPENSVVLLKNEQLEAALQLNPYNLAIGDIISEVRYVVGVSVQPESRGKGYMTRLIRQTLRMQYENGEDFSILMPIDTRIYTRYGYANCFMRHEYHVDLDRIAPKRTKYQTRRMGLSNLENLDRELHQLSEIYFDGMANKYSYVCRNRTYWKHKLSELAVDQGEIFVISDDFSQKGYAMMLPKSGDGTLNVIEMVALDKEAFDAIMGLVKAHSTQATRAVLVTPQSEEFNIYTDYDNNIKHIVKPFMMGRVIHADKILDQIIYKSNIFENKQLHSMAENFCITITDSMIPENNFSAIYKKGVISGIMREACESCLPERRLKMSVAELAQLYLKSTTINILYKMGRIELYEENIEFFETIFGETVKNNYINDFI